MDRRVQRKRRFCRSRGLSCRSAQDEGPLELLEEETGRSVGMSSRASLRTGETIEAAYGTGGATSLPNGPSHTHEAAMGREMLPPSTMEIPKKFNGRCRRHRRKVDH
ncbi:hypothetical protein N7533_005397 [Penicillium manginii]|uniref:uncharacterized protein n=1 Tax=Penicillium manginii TaxID=203109 RepID=UPI0025491B77|nr:uncharacterized protein N7533_005397 [Penicillium manginii]KAJ5755854.1 hypothetical protein N7533_005397 [Penicillium manginii]